MKFRIRTFSLALIAAIALLLDGCESTTLDVIESPNALNPSQADVNFFLNSIQVMVANIHSGEEGSGFNGLAQFGMEPVRMQHGFGPSYREFYDPGDFNRVWNN
ncbi:MAG: SusD/RagB family nutrient-binding outer membrane lipoprotein, partial [Acidimicrobiia bacterium]|nr:SusD/RagB family nutrient-binding outer membrane lipoprotein [Acidimicrobiia bacterium]